MYLLHLVHTVPAEAREQIRSPRTIVMNSSELPFRCLKLILSTQKEQSVLPHFYVNAWEDTIPFFVLQIPWWAPHSPHCDYSYPPFYVPSIIFNTMYCLKIFQFISNISYILKNKFTHLPSSYLSLFLYPTWFILSPVLFLHSSLP